MIGALNDFLFAGRTIGQAVTTFLRSGRSTTSQDLMEVMKLLVDAEMRMFRGLNVRAIFLQNLVSDLLPGMRAKPIVLEFAEHVRSTYGVEPACSDTWTCRTDRRCDREVVGVGNAA